MTHHTPAWCLLALLAGVLLWGCPDTQDDDDAADDDSGDDDAADDDGGDDTAGTPGPVRVLFVLDASSSWQCADPAAERLAVIEQRVQGLLAEPTVSIGHVLYGAAVSEQAMTTTVADLDALWTTASMEPASDLQGGLATGLALLEADHPTLDPSELPHTRYVVVVITHFSPEPVCTEGCEDVEPYPFCNDTSQVPPGVYVDIGGNCPDYNQPYQLEAHAAAMAGLETTPGVGDVAVHTLHVNAPVPAMEAACGGGYDFAAEIAAATSILTGVAAAGGGTFTAAAPGDPFLDGIDFTALSMP